MRNIGKQLHSTLGVVYSGGFRGGVGTRSGICCVGRMVWYMGSAIFYSSW